MDFKKDYYHILGVHRHSTREELKAAYRQMAKKFHPDRVVDADPAKMQEINEAYEVLSEPSQKAIYDEYFDSVSSNESDVDGKTEQSSTHRNVRRYERTYTVTETEKIFVRGRLRVKYCADALDAEAIYSRMTDYLLTPVDVLVIIQEKELDVREPSPSYLQSMEPADLFRTPLPQPIRCEVHSSTGIDYYLLQLSDIRVSNVELIDITKHDQQSFGTLWADIWAQLIHERQREHTEQVTECSGPTGREETKQEDGWNWRRQEFFHSDCSTYWSGWEKTTPIFQHAHSTRDADPSPLHRSTGWYQYYRRQWQQSCHSKTQRGGVFDSLGCSLFAGILGFAALFAFIPPLRGFLVGYLLLLLLLSVGGVLLSWLGRFIPYLLVLALAGLLLAGWRHGLSAGRLVEDRPGPTYDTLVTQQDLRPSRVRDSGGQSVWDTMITHTIRWADYDSNRYEINLSLRLAALRQSGQQHKALAFTQPSVIAEVYQKMDQYDEEGLDLVHAAFDSLRQQYDLDEFQLANAMVSCIQSVPYFLVVDQSCDAARYNDEFVRSYLATCNKDCCMGDVAFGVRSPVEFLSDLKGDCDTRALFLYSLFRRFNYDVALITSEYYRHAAIAVSFSRPPDLASSVFNIHGRNYYAWETTARGHRAGVLPARVDQLSRWQIALLNE